MSLSDDDILSVMFRCETLGQTYAQVALSTGFSRSAVGGIVKRARDARPQVEAARLSDNQIKIILDRLFFGRNAAESIAKDFAAMGKALTRQAVLYLAWWVMNDLHHAGPELGTKADNADVMDWPRWWRAAQGEGVAA